MAGIGEFLRHLAILARQFLAAFVFALPMARERRVRDAARGRQDELPPFLLRHRRFRDRVDGDLHFLVGLLGAVPRAFGDGEWKPKLRQPQTRLQSLWVFVGFTRRKRPASDRFGPSHRMAEQGGTPRRQTSAKRRSGGFDGPGYSRLESILR